MKKNVLLLISWIIGICEIILLFIVFYGVALAAAGSIFLGSYIGSYTLILFTFLLLVFLPVVILNIVAWITSKRPIILITCILYFIAGIFLISEKDIRFYSLPFFAQAILCFIAFRKMNKVNNIAVDNTNKDASNSESSNNNESIN